MFNTEWTLKFYDNFKRGPLQIVDGEGNAVAEFGRRSIDSATGEQYNPSPEAFARCQLASAAPDLLIALKGMLEWARRVQEKNPGMEIANACAAIEKAERNPYA